MSLNPDELGNLWISCPAVAERYGQAPGMVAVPFGEHEALIAAGEAQPSDVGIPGLWEVGDCSHVVVPGPATAPAPAARKTRAKDDAP